MKKIGFNKWWKIYNPQKILLQKSSECNIGYDV